MPLDQQPLDRLSRSVSAIKLFYEDGSVVRIITTQGWRSAPTSNIVACVEYHLEQYLEQRETGSVLLFYRSILYQGGAEGDLFDRCWLDQSIGPFGRAFVGRLIDVPGTVPPNLIKLILPIDVTVGNNIMNRAFAEESPL